MSKKVVLAGLLAISVAGCGYFPVQPDPIRIVDSQADVFACRRLGPVSGLVPTNGTAPVIFSSRTVAVPATPGLVGVAAPVSPAGPGLQPNLEAMRDAALALGATDLYLRRVDGDWSFVEGVAYFCRH